MRKNQKFTLGIYVIAFVLYYLLSFLMIEAKGAAFWAGCAFTLIAFFGAAGTVCLAAGNQRDGIFFGLSLILVCNTYLVVQMVLSLVLMLVSPGIKVAVILELIPLALFAIAAVSSLLGRNVTESQEQRARTKIGYLQELERELAGCIERCSDESLRRQISELKESVHFSDPMSSEALADLEGQMLVLAGQMRSEIGSNPEQASQSCCQLGMLLRERNRRCIQLK